jgi:phenylalanyl-tRNA synthetase alpha chain
MRVTDLTALEADLLPQIAGASDAAALDAVRVAALGKTGSISQLLKSLGAMSPDERRVRGPEINGLRDRVQAAVAARRDQLEAAALDARLASEHVDLTLPAPPRRRGSVHPTMQVMDELVAVFAEMGFAVAEGPDIEDDWHNFTALNFPPDHPARDTHDTFFLNPGADGVSRMLRTHTSPVQVRAMQAGGAPVRVIAPGRTFRKDSDQTHTPMFHQVEGLVVDRGIHMGHLKWTVETFIGASSRRTR